MADVNYKIGADATEVVNELNKVHKSMRDFGRIKWTELAMGAQALVGHLSTLKNIASGVWDALIAPAAEVERFMTRFSTVLGSAEAAGEHMRDLRKYAADTPFELADIAAASGVLLGFGV
jgi:phage tail tape-measure protein